MSVLGDALKRVAILEADLCAVIKRIAELERLINQLH